MAKIKMGLPMQMGIGMVAGVLVGVVAQDWALGSAVFKFLGDIFIRLIRMVVVPLVFATLVAGRGGHQRHHQTGARGHQDPALLPDHHGGVRGPWACCWPTSCSRARA